ncbi:MAG TPA: hypothetical protein VIK83_00700 [Coriobacteriia bacterium]
MSPQAVNGGPQPRRRSDDGMALAIVVGMTAILFILSTMLLSLTVYQSTASQRVVARVQAFNIADAGVNAYLYELRHDPDYYVTTPTLIARTREGSWTVTASPPSATQPYLTLRSLGSLTSREASRVVIATVRFPTFADYMFLEDCDIGIGSGALVNGKVHSNHNVSNSGRITGLATAYGSFSNGSSGRTDQGFLQGPTNVAYVPFNDVKAVMDEMKAIAERSGARGYAGPAAAGKQGYEIVISGTTYVRKTVTGFTSNGYSVATDGVTYALPTAGILYFDDDIWVRGSYGLSLTIASSANIYIVGNLQPASAGSNTTLGLIAENNVSVPGQYTVVPDTMLVQAALLARTGSVTSTSGSRQKASLTINGSLADMQYGVFSGAFARRTYTYDSRLDLYPPPMYPAVHTDSLKVQSWVER